VSFERRHDGEPVGRLSGVEEERRVVRTTRLAEGTMACPRCDAPVMPAGPVSPAQRVACPYCAHAGAVRDFLSLAAPTRPARVVVRVVARRLPAGR
jgi:uncharacterized paraquat-inducible protein A